MPDTQYKEKRSETEAEGKDEKLAIRGANRHGDRAIKLTPHIAKVVLGNDQTINPNAKLLRKLRTQRLLPEPEELGKRGLVVERGEKETVDVNVALFVVLVLVLAVAGVWGGVWGVRRWRARRAGRG